MDKELYDKQKEEKQKEEKRLTQNQKIKKYAKVLLWTTAVVLVLSGGGWYMAKSGFFTYDPLNLCVQHTGVGMHIHPHLKIFTKGEEVKIPANIGISGGCMRPIHTHDDSGTLHLEFPNVRDVALGDFFKIWEQQFDWTKVKMTVNSQENTELENYKMKDGDKIEFYFE